MVSNSCPVRLVEVCTSWPRHLQVYSKRSEVRVIGNAPYHPHAFLVHDYRSLPWATTLELVHVVVKLFKIRRLTDPVQASKTVALMNDSRYDFDNVKAQYSHNLFYAPDESSRIIIKQWHNFFGKIWVSIILQFFKLSELITIKITLKQRILSGSTIYVLIVGYLSIIWSKN